MDCFIKVNKHINNLVGSNVVLQTTMILEATDNGRLSKDFIDWYKVKNDTDKVIDINDTSAANSKKLAKAIVDYYYAKFPSTSYTSRQIADDSVSMYGYTSVADRETGKRIIGNVILDTFIDIVKHKTPVPDDKYKFYRKAVRESWLDLIFNIVAKTDNKNVDTLRKEYDEAIDKGSYIDKILGGNIKSVTYKNYYAVYQELFGSEEHALQYIKDIFASDKLKHLFSEIKDSITVLEETKAEEADNTIDSDTNTAESQQSTEGSGLGNFDHSGIYSDFTKHVSARILNYFNSLRKRTTPNSNDLDTNNVYGIADTMDAAACCSIMYSHTEDFTNLKTTIDTIRHIGQTIKGFEAFVKFAEDLATDLDFATEVRTVFTKHKVPRTELVVDGETTSFRQSDRRIDKKTALIMDLTDDIKSTVIENESSISDVTLKGINDTVKTIEQSIAQLNNTKYSEADAANKRKEQNEKVETLINDIIRLVKSYFPSVQEDAIKAYILLSNNADVDIKNKLKNIKGIISDISTVIKKSEDANINYTNMQASIKNAEDYNSKLRIEQAKGRFIRPTQFKDVNALKTDDYIDPVRAGLLQLASKIVPYSVVSTNNNTRNINGNQVSSIINSSWLTGLKQLFSSTYTEIDASGNKVLRNPILEAWGRERLKSSQYKYSNLLLEHRDTNGKIINHGIFKYVGDELVLTDDAENIIKISLFNGSSSIEDSNNASYANMTIGDFGPTVFMSFFNTVDKSITNRNVATYFLRTPSDAPKTFTIQAPRYKTNGIFKIKNLDTFNKDVAEIVASISNPLTKKDIIDTYSNTQNEVPQYTELNEDKLHIVLFPRDSIFVQNTQSIREIPNTKNEEDGTYEGYVTFATKEGDIVILQGTIDRAGKRKKIVNAKLVGTYNSNYKGTVSPTVKQTLTTNIEKRLRYKDITIGDITYKKAELEVDVTDRVYTMIKNQFKQDLLNAGVALAHYFEFVPNEDGTYSVRLDKNKPVVKKGVSLKRGFKNYHIGKNGTVFEHKGKSYVLSGNVFKSHKFTVARKINNDVEKVNFTNDLYSFTTNDSETNKINLIYGDQVRFRLSDNGTVIDVELSKTINEEIDKRLSAFIEEYTADVYNNIKDYRQFIKNTSTSRDAVNEYALNYLLTLYTADEMFEGDSGFYKDVQTLLKRAKEYQASGNPYGIADYSEIFRSNLNDAKNSFLNDGILDDGRRVQDVLDKIPDLKGTRQRNGWNAVTIANTSTTNVEALQQLCNQLIENGTPKEFAEDLLYGKYQKKSDGSLVREGGYQNVTVNDAQSYITYPEFVRRIAARGQLKRYMPLIEKIADENSELTADELSEFIQVQKNIYYDIHYNKEFNIYHPRNIKNAEFVLVPRFIKGTELETVYNTMIELGIDQLNTVETSKASNLDVLTLWDNDGNLTSNNLKKFKSEASKAKEIFSYNFLYTQQETPQHMNAENKFGIQLNKKIIDNIRPDSALAPLKQLYLKLFDINVQESASDTYKLLELSTDENGNIKLEDGTVLGLNKRVFFDKLRDELIRTGCDSNLIDHVTLNYGGVDTLMPLEMNNTSGKMESIMQSMINANITRQTLKGFHAAQVTNIGWQAVKTNQTPYVNKENAEDKLTVSEYKVLSDEAKKQYKDTRVSYSKNLEYHPKGKGYVQIMVPYSFLGIDKNSKHYKDMTDDEILAELSKEGLGNEYHGLDMILGYRIPTEGKQSACNMKIVGFIDDAYGSTIIVPNDWVAQTGSDFDIDSVYAIQYETKKRSDGKITKVNYKETVTEKDWHDYLLKKAKEGIVDGTSNEAKTIASIIEKQNNKKFKDLKAEESDLYTQLPEALKTSITKLDKIITKKLEDAGLTGNDAYSTRLNTLVSNLSKQLTKLPKDSNNYKQLDEFINKLSEIYKAINKNKEIPESMQYVYDKLRAPLNDAAKKLNLMTYEEFTDPNNIERANTRASRNTKILELMMDILSHPESLEENLARSNFDKLIEQRDKFMPKSVANERAARSPYNIQDQIKYQEEAMSGAVLKARSVILDTFCSICNTIKPTLNENIYIVYDKEDIVDIEHLEERFDTKIPKKGKTIAIRHNRYGWSGDNRNIDGMLLTAYSSQTTAYILDAIKSGSIPNVNNYTFSTWKTLVNMGSNYKTAVTFIMQPGINRITKAYNYGNSVFSNRKDNPIHEAIKSIAKDLGLEIKPNTPVNAIVAMINSKYNKEFNAIFKQQGDENIKISLNNEDLTNLPLIPSLMADRLLETGMFNSPSPVEELLFDLGIILSFNKLHNIASNIDDITRCTNPDKFGAKQSLFSTRKVFKDIRDCIYKVENTSDGEILKEKPAVLSVNGKHILESIYPGMFDNGGSVTDMINSLVTNNRSDESSYRTLYSFLKNSSASSILIGQQVFATEDPKFISFVEGLSDVLGEYNSTLDEKTYNSLKKYIIADIFAKCPAIKYPIKVRNTNGTISLEYDVKGDINDSNSITSQQEKARIYGYSHRNNLTIKKPIKRGFEIVNVEIKDINNPTKDELELFELFSPAQKIQFIKEHFTNAGLFNYIKPVLFNGSEKGTAAGTQTIEFIDDNINKEIIYSLFNEVFYNNNPLLVSAAIDIIKYAVQVEGYSMSKRAVSKVINNDVLINEFGDKGLGFVDYFRQQIYHAFELGGIYSTKEAQHKLYENYLRSHPDTKGIKTTYITDKNRVRFGFVSSAVGTYLLEKDNNNKDDAKNVKEFDELLTRVGVKTYYPLSETYKTNKYVRLVERGKNTLYKIHDKGSYVILTPLNNLERNENDVWSVKESNNTDYFSAEAYDAIVNKFVEDKENSRLTSQYIRSQVIEHQKQNPNDTWTYKKRTNSNEKLDALNFSIESMAIEDGGYWSNLKDNIVNHFYTKRSSEPLYVRSLQLGDYIKTPTEEYGSVQQIVMPDGTRQNFVVFIPGNIKLIEQGFITGDKTHSPRSYIEIQNNSLRNIIKSIQDAGVKTNSDNRIFEIVEVPEVFNATIEEVDLDTLSYGENLKSQSVEAGIDYHNTIRSITDANSIQSLKDNAIDINRANAKLANDMREYIEDKLVSRFCIDPDDHSKHLDIRSSKVKDIIKKDAKLLDKYIETCNQIQAYIDRFGQYNGLDVSSADPDMQFNIDRIKKNIKSVRELPLATLMETAAEVMAEKISSNPLLKDNLISIMDGFWKTYGNMWKYNDVMENGTPILQIILKDVMGDINAKEKASIDRRRKFRQDVDDIYARAKASGYTINLDNIVDKDGRFIRNYKPEFAEEFERLRSELLTSKQKGLGSIEHLKAKLAYDEFKAKHINQEAAPEYYINRNRITRALLYGFDTPTGHYEGIPELYSEFMKLYYRRLELFQMMDDDGFSKDQEEELHEITYKMQGLYSNDFYRIGTQVFDRQHADFTNLPTGVLGDTLRMYSFEAADSLGRALGKLTELNEKYFERKPFDGFKEQLDYHLSIVRTAEQPDADGVPQVNRLILLNNTEYQKSRAWLLRNARFVFTDTLGPNGQPTGLRAKLKEAFRILSLGRNAQNNGANGVIQRVENAGRTIRDAEGTVNTQLLSESEIEEIYNAQKDVYNVANLPAFSDRILLGNGSPVADEFDSSFYQGMRTDNSSTKSREYYQAITKLNKLLEKYYKATDGKIHLEEIPDTLEGIEELKQIAELYQEIRKNKTSNATPARKQQVKQFIEDNVEFVINEPLWIYQNEEAAKKSSDYLAAWNDVVFERNEDGSYQIINGKYIANKFLYSYAKPKGNPGDASYDKWVNNRKRDARRLVDHVYAKVPTQYYYQEVAKRLEKARANRDNSYKEWYNKNHVYNPFTRKMEPLDCWVTSEVRTKLLESNAMLGTWQPTSKSSKRKVKDGYDIDDIERLNYDPAKDKRNKNYNPDASLLDNYVKGSQQGIYDSDITLNDYEKELQNYLYDTLVSTAHTEQGKRYFTKGYLPKQAKKDKTTVKSVGKELLKLVGIGTSVNNGDKPFTNDDDIEFYNYSPDPMPMTELLDNKLTIDLNKQLKNLNKQKLNRNDFNSDDEYNAAVDELENFKKELKDRINAERRALLDRDWITVIDNYLQRADAYNAIQDNVQKLYFLLNTLKKMKMYSRQYGSYGDLKKTKRSTDEVKDYDVEVDKNLIAQYKNFIRKFVFDQWKEAEGKAVKYANFLQGFTSADYMMLNIRGGIANVTLGETGIFAEAAAREYITPYEWHFGSLEWHKSIIAFGRGGFHQMFNNESRSFSKQDAIAKYMNVVDYDEKTGVVREITLEEYSKRIRDFMFCPQTIGEHFMQNSVLFGMMKSHKLITTIDGKVIPMNERMFMEYKKAEILESVLDDEQKEAFNKFKEEQKKDKDVLKDYAWFRKDILTEWLYIHTSDEQRKAIEAKMKAEKANLKKEFKDKVSIYDQIELGKDGFIKFIDGSELANLHTVQADVVGDVYVTQATQILGEFSEKVRKVNNKIHGVYNRLGSAYIEKNAFGSLIMQYHKHLPIGLLKRYRARGYYNEFRDSVDKGMVQTIKDIASLNYRKIKAENNLTDTQLGAMEGIAFMFTHMFDYITQMRTTLSVIPEYEKANLLRNVGDLVGVLGSMATIAFLWYLASDNDDLEENLMFNLAVYEADRLCSEAFMYNPYGMINEGKKLMSTPVAAQSVIIDAAKSIGLVGRTLFDDDFDPYYHSGRYAGEHKLSVYMQRRIPIWNGIRSVIDLESNNRYYKLGQTPITGLNIKEAVQD